MKKFLKWFICTILSIWLMILLTVFGAVLSFKNVITGTIDNVIKEEIKTTVKDNLEEYYEEANESMPADMIEKFEDEIDNNQEIKNLMDNYLDKFVDILLSDDPEEIDISSDLDTILDTGEYLLSSYDITITEEERKEILSAISKEDINELVNDTIKETKEELSEETITLLNIYQTLTSTKTKIIITSLIIVTLLLLALIKKSYYKWLSNLLTTTLLVGLVYAFIIPAMMNFITNSIEISERIVISLSSIKTYGYVLLSIGVLSAIILIIISTIKKKKNKQKDAQ